MKKFKNTYRIASTRLRYWDYGSNALYFVTICCKSRECFFGEILDEKMAFSEIGEMAEKYWLQIPQHFPFVVLHNHIIMPNHVHGILEIAKTDNVDGVGDDDVTDDDRGVGDDRGVETQDFASLRQRQRQRRQRQQTSPPSPTSKNQFGPQSQNLASIVRGFKIGVTKNARKINPDFQWQPRYHDHIIRNKTSYYNISNYILNNPTTWNEDQFNANNTI